MGSLALALARARGSAHNSAAAFNANQLRLRLTASRAPVTHGVVRAAPPLDGRRLVALTFDDGPSPANTPALLDLLDRHGARATFFMVGDRAEQHPELARLVVARGHEAASHSYRHAHPASATLEELERDHLLALDAIEATAGVRPAVTRPPFGKRARALARIAGRHGQAVVLWTIDSGDTARRSTSQIAVTLIRRAVPGDIVLLHDGGDERPRTLAATESALIAMGAAGFEFVTVSELLAASRVAAAAAGARADA